MLQFEIHWSKGNSFLLPVTGSRLGMWSYPGQQQMQNVLLGASHSSGRKSLLLNAVWDVMSGTSAAILLQQDKVGPQRMRRQKKLRKVELGVFAFSQPWSLQSYWTFNKFHIALLLSRSSRVRLCATPETAAHQAPPSLGFSRQEHWSGLPFPSPMHENKKWKWSRLVVSDS